MKIGLTQTENPEKHQYYIDWLKGNDDIEVIPLSAEAGNLDELENCDALVLSGGIDIYPAFYGGVEQYPDAPENGWKKERDVFEIDAFESALEQSIPILGICRGLQMINVIHKGTLQQHLQNEQLIQSHKGNPDKQHAVTIVEQSLLHDLVDTDRADINSAHHQAIDKLGEGLMANCLSDDGIIEGVEWADKTNKPFMLAVQWHPERMFRFQLQDTPLSGKLRKKFIEEVRKSIENKR
ncbi:MAG: gamma-glutamyl-gamma-aminobutyrate hydrolase family protein [Chitinophagaceae bacterium]